MGEFKRKEKKIAGNGKYKCKKGRAEKGEKTFFHKISAAAFCCGEHKQKSFSRFNRCAVIKESVFRAHLATLLTRVVPASLAAFLSSTCVLRLFFIVT